MAQRAELPGLTPSEYLAGELETAERHEYVAGQVFAMGGASRAHNTITTNLCALIRPHLRGGPCRLFVADMKVRIGESEAFYYPDLVIACAADEDDYFVTQPTLIAEVLSPSTEALDRREKRAAYQRLDSLHDLLLISQHEPAVELYRRGGQNGWGCTRFGKGEAVPLAGIKLELALADIYEDVF